MNSVDSKSCSNCGTVFTPEEFVTSPHLEPVGIAADYTDSQRCNLYFRHARPECMASLTLPVEFFRSRIKESIPKENLLATPACPRHCTTVADLRCCPATCAIAPYRRFMLKLIRVRESQSA